MTTKHEQNHEPKYEQKYEQNRERNNREKDHKQNHEQNRTMHETVDSATPSLDWILSTKPHEPNLLERVEEAEAPLDTRVEKLLVRLAHASLIPHVFTSCKYLRVILPFLTLGGIV
jgi:hypothetical protein